VFKKPLPFCTSEEDFDKEPAEKRAYYHRILAKTPKHIKYENHILFDEVNQGQVVGARTLLDFLTFNKQIQQNSIRFSEQLGMNYDEFYES
jgi:iron-sulfur cluster repair protein YtfE (RIC family)